jgi:hypothetical protein
VATGAKMIIGIRWWNIKLVLTTKSVWRVVRQEKKHLSCLDMMSAFFKTILNNTKHATQQMGKHY